MITFPSYDIAVLGGGLAGLAAAIQAARAGQSVILFEKAPQLGGRATTLETNGFYFNQGPHALYRRGHGAQALRDLGISYHGHRATYDGSWVLLNGQPYPMPGSAEAVMNSSFISEAGKAELIAFKTRLMNGYAVSDWDHTSLREWLDTQIHAPDVRALLEGQFRLATYCDELGEQSAGAALAQTLVASLDGVDYLDGGWQTLVRSLEEVALAAGVTIQNRRMVTQLDFQPQSATLHFADAHPCSCRAVISTLPPAAIARLAGPLRAPSLRLWAEKLTPIHAGCLDVALSRLPCPDYQFGIGLDRPIYYSVHTRSAKLAPEGGTLIQLAKYLKTGSDDNAADLRGELGSLMDLFQPGWREVLVQQRFMPRLLVSNAVVTAAGRPSVSVPEIPNLFLAGDWVGPEGMLADASLASARRSAECVLDWLQAPDKNRHAKPSPLHA